MDDREGKMEREKEGCGERIITRVKYKAYKSGRQECRKKSLGKRNTVTTFLPCLLFVFLSSFFASPFLSKSHPGNLALLFLSLFFFFFAAVVVVVVVVVVSGFGGRMRMVDRDKNQLYQTLSQYSQ